MPATVSLVLAVTADPESCAEDLVNAILPDQAMCATILKFANSTFFGIPRDVATMSKAINVLGFSEVQNIVLGKAVFNSFKKIGRKNKKSINMFWVHSFSCGLAASIIAKDLKCPQSELFIAGLLHDIGKLIFLLALPEDYKPILDQEITDQLQCRQEEFEAFGIDHCLVGYKILNRWLFPQRLLTSVAHHHQPEECEDYTLYAIIVEISDALTHLVATKQQRGAENLFSQLLSLLPERESLWRQQQLTLNNEVVQKWMSSLEERLEKDSGILQSFTA